MASIDAIPEYKVLEQVFSRNLKKKTAHQEKMERQKALFNRNKAEETERLKARCVENVKGTFTFQDGTFLDESKNPCTNCRLNGEEYPRYGSDCCRSINYFNRSDERAYIGSDGCVYVTAKSGKGIPERKCCARCSLFCKNACFYPLLVQSVAKAVDGR